MSRFSSSGVRARTWLIASAAVAAVALSASGSSAASKPAAVGTKTPKPTSSTPKNLCTVITADDAARVFGEPATEKPSPGSEPLVEGLCIYGGASPDVQIRNLLQVRIYEGEQFYGERLFPKSQPLRAISKRAFIDVDAERHKIEVQFVVDGMTGTVNYTAGPGVDVTTKVAAVKQVANTLAGSV